MMDFDPYFDNKLVELNRYMDQLQILEKAAQPGGGLEQSLKAAEMLKAGAFLIAYNCVEASIRHAFSSIRKEIAGKKKMFHMVEDYWRHEGLWRALSGKLISGMNHESFVKDIDRMFSAGSRAKRWDFVSEHLPVSGTVDHEALIAVCRKLGIQLNIPKELMGGSQLKVIADTRNHLAHGDRTFSEVGSLYTHDELDGILKGSVSFVKIVLAELQNYKDGAKYLPSNSKLRRNRSAA